MNHSELRKDIVSGDWIVVSPKRLKKPGQFVKNEKRFKAPLKDCPFENPQKTGHEKPKLIYEKNGDWLLQIIENKYPAFIHGAVCPKIEKSGPYSIIEAIGHHDLLITRNHYKNFSKLNPKDAYLVFKAFQEYYQKLADDKCVAYVAIFHNWGPKAGASVFHPHYQIISIPVVPTDISHSLAGSERYFKNNKKCVHCAMIDWEKKNKNRIVYENKGAVVFTPFASKEPFEIRIFPKKHLSYFEDAPEKDLKQVVEALQKALLKMEINLKDPDYNFFIHTSPILDKKKHDHYHWHIEIQPKISISAGFELGTGIEITVVDPDEAAKILKK
ncbi:HIT domain-containing protein [Candidatus Wolfebacteria bacterium]|nr:HIT domain-containing protein [Candidatus Wolfebacteria bacterium]